MKISGDFNYSFKPKAPTINATVSSVFPALKGKVEFLVDTGASVTLLLDKDFSRLGIEAAKLRKAPFNVSGVGGGIETYLLDDAQLIFQTDSGEEYIESVSLYVGIHNFAQLDEAAKRKILAMPSLLGRDILNKFHVYCSAEKELVYLEK